MSRPQTPEPTLDGQGDASVGSPDEDVADGIQHSHRMLSFSDALLSIIATVMVRGGPGPLRGEGGAGPAQVLTWASRERSVPREHPWTCAVSVVDPACDPHRDLPGAGTWEWSADWSSDGGLGGSGHGLKARLCLAAPGWGAGARLSTASPPETPSWLVNEGSALRLSPEET